MKKRVLFLAALFSCLCLSGAAGAEMNYYNADRFPVEKDTEGPAGEPENTAPPAKSFTVTSIQKCYEQLSRADRLDIQKNFVKPYKECQRRLALKLEKEQDEKKRKAKKSAEEKRRKLYRVREEPEEETPPEKTARDE